MSSSVNYATVCLQPLADKPGQIVKSDTTNSGTGQRLRADLQRGQDVVPSASMKNAPHLHMPEPNFVLA